MKGTVKKAFTERGFYFLAAEGESDALIFLHFTQVRNRAPAQIKVGDIVEFELGADKAGRTQARNARVIDPPGTECGPIRFGDIGYDEAA